MNAFDSVPDGRDQLTQSQQIVPTDTQCHCLWEAAHTRARQFGLSEEEAEDCALGFLEHMLQGDRLLPYLSSKNPSRESWLFTCAEHWVQNTLRSHIRLKRRERSLNDLESGSFPTLRVLLLPVTPETEVIRLELCARIQNAVKRLTPRQQSLFHRYFVLQESVAELALARGTTRNALHQSLHVLRRRLHTLLTSDTLDASEAYDYLLFLHPRLVLVRSVRAENSE